MLASVAVTLWLMVSGSGMAHGWRHLEGQLSIRWVETRTDFTIEPPLAPQWIRDLRKRGIHVPTDLPLERPGASFAADGNKHTVAWYVIKSAKPSNDLWHVDKESIQVFAVSGEQLPWPGGTGSVLIDHERNLQFLYLGVPPELVGKRANIRLRLARFDGTKTEEIAVPF